MQEVSQPRNLFVALLHTFSISTAWGRYLSWCQRLGSNAFRLYSQTHFWKWCNGDTLEGTCKAALLTFVTLNNLHTPYFFLGGHQYFIYLYTTIKKNNKQTIKYIKIYTLHPRFPFPFKKHNLHTYIDESVAYPNQPSKSHIVVPVRHGLHSAAGDSNGGFNRKEYLFPDLGAALPLP